MKNILILTIFVSTSIALTACGGNSDSSGNHSNSHNNNDAKVENNKIKVNIPNNQHKPVTTKVTFDYMKNNLNKKLHSQDCRLYSAKKWGDFVDNYFNGRERLRLEYINGDVKANMYESVIACYMVQSNVELNKHLFSYEQAVATVKSMHNKQVFLDD